MTNDYDCGENFFHSFSPLAPSLLISFTGIPSPPAAPTQANNTCLCANLTWDTPEYDGASSIRSFVITLPLPHYPFFITERVLGPNATSADICSLKPNIRYNVSIISENAVGNSSVVTFPVFIEATGQFCEPVLLPLYIASHDIVIIHAINSWTL